MQADMNKSTVAMRKITTATPIIRRCVMRKGGVRADGVAPVRG
jgi:hypothetical protein